MRGSICDICSNKCFGIEGYDGSCCSVEDRDYIIGPMKDSNEFILRLKNQLDREVDWDDVFITHEEGSKLFPNKSVWQDPGNYPAMRLDMLNDKLPCVFYNTNLKFCTVHSIRPQTCQDYFCDYLSDSLKGETSPPDPNLPTSKNPFEV